MILATKGAVAHSGGPSGLPYLWVSVGDSGKLYTSTSTTASSWTSRTSSFGGGNITAVASNGTSLYVAVAQSGLLATSPDGITWTQRTSGFGSDDILEVAYGDGYWVIVGQSGKIATSTDGITWTLRTSGTTQDLRAVAFGNGLFVAHEGGGSYRFFTASDPTTTWTARTSTFSSALFGRNAVYYCPYRAIWVAGCDSGTSGALAYSTNGTTWTAASSAFAVSGLNNTFCSIPSAIANFTTTSVIPSAMDTQSSTTGTSWTNRTPSFSNDSPQCMSVDDLGTLVLLGFSVGIQTSTNGTSWTTRTYPSSGMRGICHSSALPGSRP